MNTPAHLLVNLALLGGGPRRRHAGAIALGAVLPDLPMLGFYLWERWVQGTPSRTVWAEHYFLAGWQSFFDLFNSLPLFVLGALLAWWRRQHAAALLCASALLHCLLDLPLHREDGHRHLLPFSDWRFMSPVSYWDPAHAGTLGAGVETLLLVASAAVLWRRHAHAAARAPVAALAALAVAAWILFYGFGRLPDF